MAVVIEAKPRPDAYAPWDTLIVWLLLVATVLVAEFSPDPWHFASVFLASALWLIVGLIRICINLFARCWRRILSIVVALLSAGLFVWGWSWAGVSPDEVRFLIWRSNYEAEVGSEIIGPGGIKIAIWPWRHWTGGMAGTPDYFTVLVYDSSDQIALPRSNRTADWYKSADAAGLEHSIIIHPETMEDPKVFDDSVGVSHLEGHFYLLSGMI
jgi:energy-coupling factor transporter transmembrane protein EcfT